MGLGQSGMTKERGKESGLFSTFGGLLIKRSLPLAALPGLSWDLTTSGAGQVRNPNTTEGKKSD